MGEVLTPETQWSSSEPQPVASKNQNEIFAQQSSRSDFYGFKYLHEESLIENWVNCLFCYLGSQHLWTWINNLYFHQC